MSEETIVSEVLAASIGGAISAGLLYPLEVLKTKMQATNEGDGNGDDDDVGDRSMLQFARKLRDREGYAVFFRGVETSSFQSALEKALYFFAYTGLKSIHRTWWQGGGGGTAAPTLDTATNLLLGCAAEWAHLPITLPVDAWTTQIQTSSLAPMTILWAMLAKDKNKKDWYKGIQAYYLLCFKPALQYTIYEQVKAAVLVGRENKNLSAAEAFFLGMVARTIATLLVYPFLRAKVLLQTSSSTTTTKPQQQQQNSTTSTCSNGGSSVNQSAPVAPMDVLRQQWRQSGLAGLYFGIGPELSRGILSSALMLMIKERIAVMVRQFLAHPQQQCLYR